MIVRPITNMMARRKPFQLMPKLMASLSSADETTLPEFPSQNIITSTSNAYVKHLVSLRSKSQYRSSVQRILLVSTELISEAASASWLEPIALFVSEDSKTLSIPGMIAERIYIVSEAVMKKINGLESIRSVQLQSSRCRRL